MADERYLDVQVELNPFELATLSDPEQAVAEIVRAKAEVECLAAGVTLRHSVPVEVYTRPGLDRATGRSVLLVATRWAIDGEVA